MESETIDPRTVAQRLDAIHDCLEKLEVRVRGLVTSQTMEAKGYIVRDEAVKWHVRPDLQVAVSIAYAFGWRMRREVLTLRRIQVNLNACTIRLEPGTKKKDEGRLVYLTRELVEMLQTQAERIQILEMDLGRSVEWLFPYLSGEHKGGRIQDFLKTWKTACTKRAEEIEADPHAVLLKMLRYDFRRTAVRNLVNRGVPGPVAMKITVHKTRAVFDRYHIVSPAGSRRRRRN